MGFLYVLLTHLFRFVSCSSHKASKQKKLITMTYLIHPLLHIPFDRIDLLPFVLSIEYDNDLTHGRRFVLKAAFRGRELDNGVTA